MISQQTDTGKNEVQFTKEYFSETFGCDRIKRFGQQWWSVRMYASITDRWMRIIHGNRLLEIGCGHGFTLQRLEKDYTTYGVDVSAYAISQAAHLAPGSKCCVGNVEKGIPESLCKYPFDFILARYVLEHLKDPGKVLKRIQHHLRPGGLLFFSVPNTESMGARLKGGDWYALKDPTHISLLPPDAWLALTRQAGFRVIKEFSDGYWDLPYLPGVSTWVQAPLFMGPTILACLTARDILPARCGENIMVIAQKPPRKGSIS